MASSLDQRDMYHSQTHYDGSIEEWSYDSEMVSLSIAMSDTPMLDTSAFSSQAHDTVESHTSLTVHGPLTSVVSLVRRPRRGGRPANRNRVGKRRVFLGPPLDPKSQKRNTTIARKLKACSRCARLHIQCHIDPDDYLGPCLTCMWSSQSCPRFEIMEATAVSEIIDLMPHNDDALRIFVESQSDSGPVRSPQLRLQSMFPDLTLFGRAARNVESVFPTDYQIATTIVAVHKTSDDFTWNAFRAAFKLGFNPKWAQKTRALRYALLIWKEDMDMMKTSIILSQQHADAIDGYYRSIGALDAAEAASTHQEYMLKLLHHIERYDKGKGLDIILGGVMNEFTQEWLSLRQPYVYMAVDELIKLAKMEDRLSRLIFHLALLILRHCVQSLLEDWQRVELESHKHLFPWSELTHCHCI